MSLINYITHFIKLNDEKFFQMTIYQVKCWKNFENKILFLTLLII